PAERAEDQGDDQQDDEDDEQHLGDPGGGHGDAAEAKEPGDHRQHEQHNDPVEHSALQKHDGATNPPNGWRFPIPLRAGKELPPRHAGCLGRRRHGVAAQYQGNETMATQKGFSELCLSFLRDIYYAERQILKALPKMAKAAESEQLKQALMQHREETEH